jgi:arylsulfatase A-like enzyme
VRRPAGRPGPRADSSAGGRERAIAPSIPPAIALLVALALAVGCGGSDGAPGNGNGSGSGGGGGGAGAGAARGAAPDLSRANLVILSLDTLRADGPSTGGGKAGISPALARFAEEAVVFTHARAQAPHTAPSHMTLFTSTYPSVHDVQNVAHGTDAQGKRESIIIPLAKEIPTLAEVLTASDFRCVGLTDGGNVNPAHGFDRGFQTYTRELTGAQAQVDDALARLPELTAPGAARFFLFWHTYQIHAPYVPPEPYLSAWAPAAYDGLLKPVIASLEGKSFNERWSAMPTVFWKDRERFGWPESAYLRGLYNGEIRFTDTQLERLFDALRASGVFDDSIVIVLSDHGEEFFEHGKWQHEQLYEECVRVPLMVRLPGGFHGGTRLETPVGLIDVMPTVLELLGVHPAADALPGAVRSEGRSLADAILGAREPHPLPVYSEFIATRGPNFEHILAIHAAGSTFLYDEVRGQRRDDGSLEHHHELYDLLADPTQQQDIASKVPGRVAEFLRQREIFLELVELERLPDTERQRATISPELREQFDQLGY